MKAKSCAPSVDTDITERIPFRLLFLEEDLVRFSDMVGERFQRLMVYHLKEGASTPHEAVTYFPSIKAAA